MSFFPYQTSAPQILARRIVRGMEGLAINQNVQKPPTPQNQPRERHTGVVKWFDKEGRGYGFIERPGLKDMFVHIRSLEKCGIDNLLKGQKVSFHIKKQDGKERAVHIKLEG